jgi:hypothetical protein
MGTGCRGKSGSNSRPGTGPAPRSSFRFAMDVSASAIESEMPAGINPCVLIRLEPCRNARFAGDGGLPRDAWSSSNAVVWSGTIRVPAFSGKRHSEAS